MSSSTIRHRKSSSEPSSPSQRPRKTTTQLSPTPAIPMVEQSTGGQQIQVTSLSLTSLLTTLTTTEAITTTARKLYTYPTKRLSSSDLWRKYKNDEDSLPSSATASGSVTPPPDYEEESLAITANPSGASMNVTTSAVVPMAIPLPHLATQPEPECATLVSAKFATQGHNLLSLSLSEPSNSTFRRHLYLDSLTYLLRALPSDLSPAESTQLLSALPPPVLSYLQPSTHGDVAALQHAPIEHPTVHRLLSVVTASTVSTVRNLTPHVKSLAQTTWEYNLKYRVAERGLEKVRSTVEGNLRFWRAVAEWVMFEDCEQPVTQEDEQGTQIVTRGRKMRYGGGMLRNVGRFAGGFLRSGVEGVMEGFIEGMKVS